MSARYEMNRRPDGSYEIRRMWASGMSWDVVDTARNEARARLLLVRYNREASSDTSLADALAFGDTDGEIDAFKDPNK